MWLTSWRPDQVLALAVVTVFCLGAGFAAGYISRGSRDRVAQVDANLAASMNRPESYERLWQMPPGDSVAGEMAPSLRPAIEPPISSEIPMDGLVTRARDIDVPGTAAH